MAAAHQNLLLAAVLLCLTGAVAPATAQSQDDGAEKTDTDDPCQAEPDDPGGDTKRNGAEANGISPEELERCKGVLTPPKTGDQEIEEPAPDTGETPVLPPGGVPEQPPN
jgi:hypothetical protein